MENWIRVFIATMFNLLFEYSMRGINDLFQRPFLPLFLLMVYFPYFAILEHCIEKYRMRDYHVLIAGFVFGALAAFFIPGGMFNPPLLFGLNWASFFFITVVWWGTFQAVFTFYIARAIVQSRRYATFLAQPAPIILTGILVCMLFLFRFAIKSAPQIPVIGAILIVFMACAGLLTLHTTLPGKPVVFTRHKILDILAFATIILFIFCALFLTDKKLLGIHYVNTTSVIVVVAWTLIVFGVLWLERIISKKEIPV